MGKWEYIEFKELVDNLDGKRIPIKSSERKNSNGGKYPYYGASGIIDYVDEYIFVGEHLLISEDGANLLARVYPIAFIAKGKFWVNNHAHIVKAKKDKTTNEFLEYYFSSINISEFVTGSAQPKLNQRKLNSIPIPLPPLPEQKRIVAKLDALFAKIDVAIQLLTENIAHTQALMGSVLDEEFGKLECESHLLKSVSDKIQYGYTGKTKEKGKYYYLRITDIQDGKVDYNKAPFSDINEEEAKKYILNQGDILFARTGATAGKSYLFNDKEASVFASYLIRVVVDQKVLVPSYLKWYFQSDEYWSQIFGNIVGAAQPNFNGKKLGELDIPVPSLKIQTNCVAKFEKYDKVLRNSIQTQTQKLAHLKQLKSSLLDKAFKGEL